MQIVNAVRVAVIGLAALFVAHCERRASAAGTTCSTPHVDHLRSGARPEERRRQTTHGAAEADRQRHRKPDEKFDRQEVDYDTTEAPGTIIIDTKNKFLYYVQGGGKALRMGVGVGREGFGWNGTVHIGSKQEAPKWFPPPEMIARQPELAKYEKEGMPGGEGNPLGVRALYLHDEKGKDTLYRIHGTIEPWSIGLNVSSGCIRMLNENVTELYDLVDVGTKVIVM